MKRYVLVICFLLSSFSFTPEGHAAKTSLQIAYEKDGYLWIESGGKQEKITAEVAEYPYPPQWSHDGKWLLYQKRSSETPNPNMEPQNELWVYNLKDKQHKKVFYDGYNPKWSPKQNIIAFMNRGVLNISDLDHFYNIALGVDDYNWFPDGKSFIASSSASLRPDGWTNPIIYKIPVPENLKSTNLMKAERLFVIPKQLSKGETSLPSINVGSFVFSPEQQWISFIVSPTASLSMDSNMLCVISADYKQFEVLDEIIMHLDKPQWAQSKNLLGYIAGGGRIVFGFKNKDLNVTELPALNTTEYTPPEYADMGFTWIGNQGIIVSRVKEAEWSNDPKHRPKAALYAVNLGNGKQVKITNPKQDNTDVQPQYIAATNQITWLRKQEASLTGDLWLADPDGKNPKRWLSNIGQYAIFTH